MIRCTLGIDLGTSGVKVAVLDQTGEVLTVASRSYPVMSPHRRWAESDPRQWKVQTQAAITEALGACPDAQVEGIGIAGQMHGVVFTTIDGNPIRPAVLWPDSRAGEIVNEWEQVLPDPDKADLANPLAAGMAGPIVAWFARHDPTVLEQAHSILFAKDWLRNQLVPGTFGTDPSDASASLLWNVRTDSWSEPLCSIAGIPPTIFPPVFPSTEVAGSIPREVAQEWGLPEGTPVAVGSGDVAATLRGLDSKPGQISLIIGTGAQLLQSGVTARPELHPRVHTYHSWDGSWYAMAAIVNAGLALQRVLELLGADWSELYRAADHVATAATPLFLPYFGADRFVPGAHAGRAFWSGLDLATRREDLLYAALESLTFQIAQGLNAMPTSSEDPVNTVGGGAAVPTFMQLLADATGRSFRSLDVPNATAIGAALLAPEAATQAVTGAAQPVVRPRANAILADRFQRFQQRQSTLDG